MKLLTIINKNKAEGKLFKLINESAENKIYDMEKGQNQSVWEGRRARETLSKHCCISCVPFCFPFDDLLMRSLPRRRPQGVLGNMGEHALIVFVLLFCTIYSIHQCLFSHDARSPYM